MPRPTHRWTRIILTLSVAGCLAAGMSAAHAADEAQVSGLVTRSADGLPLAGATVAAFDVGGATPVATTTAGLDGHYSLPLPAGTYRICAGDLAAQYHPSCTPNDELGDHVPAVVLTSNQVVTADYKVADGTKFLAAAHGPATAVWTRTTDVNNRKWYRINVSTPVAVRPPLDNYEYAYSTTFKAETYQTIRYLEMDNGGSAGEPGFGPWWRWNAPEVFDTAATLPRENGCGYVLDPTQANQLPNFLRVTKVYTDVFPNDSSPRAIRVSATIDEAICKKIIHFGTHGFTGSRTRVAVQGYAQSDLFADNLSGTMRVYHVGTYLGSVSLPNGHVGTRYWAAVRLPSNYRPGHSYTLKTTFTPNGSGYPTVTKTKKYYFPRGLSY